MGKTKELRLPILVSFLFTTFMVFYTKIPTIAVLGACAIFAIYIFASIHRLYNVTESIFLSTIILVPTSTISIFGTSYSSFPLSWFHLFVILLFIIIAFTTRIKGFYFFTTLLFVCYAGIMALFTVYVYDAMKQVLTISLFLVSFIIGSSLAKSTSDTLLDTATDLYIVSTLAFATQVFLQRTFIRSSGTVIGHYAAMGQGRLAYSGLMGDYSFATLYLASGCVLVLIKYMEWRNINFILFIIEETFLLSAIIAVTSRTGIVALAVIFAVYFLKNLKRIGWKTTVLLFAGIIAIPIVINELIASRSGQSFLDSSGRLENYLIALKYFDEKPLFGIGLGIENLTTNLHIGIPHNFFVQYLLQIGVVGVLILLLFYVEFFRKDLEKDNPLRWAFWLIVIGSMLIPDVFSSRYYYVIIVMCMLPMVSRGNEYEQKKS